jgi:hypothetical protein
LEQAPYCAKLLNSERPKGQKYAIFKVDFSKVYPYSAHHDPEAPTLNGSFYLSGRKIPVAAIEYVGEI